MSNAFANGGSFEPGVPQTRKLVSIGLFVYNGEDLLDETLHYLLEQDYEEIEVILCDDASTDTTSEIAQKWAARDPRVRYMRNDRNLGIWKNPLYTFALAKGEYFMWAPHDDIWEKNFISKLVEVLDRDQTAVAAFCSIGIVDYEGELVQTKYDDMPASIRKLGTFQMYQLWFDMARWVDGTIASALYRRSVLADAIEYVQSRPSVKGCWDRIIPLYLLSQGDIQFVPDRLFYRRMKKGVKAKALAAPPTHRARGRRMKDIIIRALSPIYGFQYYRPIWLAMRSTLRHGDMTVLERMRIEGALARIILSKYWHGVTGSLFSWGARSR
jgi:glycosyltransferase involved in cell wall biosynthesis